MHKAGEKKKSLFGNSVLCTVRLDVRPLNRSVRHLQGTMGSLILESSFRGALQQVRVQISVGFLKKPLIFSEHRTQTLLDVCMNESLCFN